MSNSPAKYDFYPGCLAVIIKVDYPSDGVLGKIVTCLRQVSYYPDGYEVTRPVWEVDQVFEWDHNTFWPLVPQDCLMPLPPDEGLILSEEELLLLCVKEK